MHIADAATIVPLTSKLIRETSLTSEVAREAAEAVEFVQMGFCVLVEFLTGAGLMECLAMA